MASKQIKKYKPVKHPFSRNKLKVLDHFVPAPSETLFSCASCQGFKADGVTVIEAEVEGDKPYYVFECTACKKSSWFIASV